MKNEIQRIIRLQEIANRFPDAFNDATKVTKSHILAVNILARIHVLEENEKKDNNVSRLKCGRPLGSKDVALHKRGEESRINAFTFGAIYE